MPACQKFAVSYFTAENKKSALEQSGLRTSKSALS
jgi:hypothetical protein